MQHKNKAKDECSERSQMNEQMRILLEMLDKSQWQTLEEIRNKQHKHFHSVLKHAKTTVPFYQTYDTNVSFDNCPILTRDQVQLSGDALVSQNIPDTHGAQYIDNTSGSTGKAVKVIATDFTRLFYNALMLREHNWLQRDFSKMLVSIRWAKRGYAEAPNGIFQSTWGPPINDYYVTGPSVFINVASQTSDQISALLTYKPFYLFSYPSQLQALAEYCITYQIAMPFLFEVRSTGETFTDACLKSIKKAWPHVKITDIYSSVEIGIIAQQCPEYGAYHVNAENVLLEIVDENNQACDMGKPGRVLATTLLNYAKPFIRYEIGDYAEWGGSCSCGRGLPVIKKIHGRKRNRIVYPNGTSGFPYLGEREEYRQIVTVQKFQFIQHTIHEVEIKLVVESRLNDEAEIKFKELIQKNLGYPFKVTLSYHDHIPLGPTGKYEEFISLVDV